MKKTLLIGEPMVLFFAQEFGGLENAVHFKKGIAGAEVNVGIGLSRLEHPVEYITKLSTDEFGKYIKKFLESEKIGTKEIIETTEHPTGMMFKEKVEVGDPQTAYYRKNSASSTLTIEEISNIDFSEYRLLHMTGIPAAISESVRKTCFHILQEAKNAGCYITFDPNLRPSLWEDEQTMVEVLNEMASYADIVLPGLSEGEILVGTNSAHEIAEFYHEMGCEHVVIKCGSKGAYLSSMDSHSEMISGFKVEKIIDTVGAGDGFAVGIISGYLEELSMKEIVERGNAIGALQLTDASDNGALPTHEQLRTFIKKQGR